MNFLSKMKQQILIADGAMGTLLYSYGKDTCLEELNLTSAERIEAIHRAYIDAGADVIQTNTYAANYLKLKRYGLEDSVKEINTAAIRLAKKAADKRVSVLGTIGGNRGIKPNSTSIEEIKRSFREQLYCLLLEGVDGLLLETYYDREELVTLLEIARKETNLPIVAQVSLQEIGIMQDHTPLSVALQQLEDLGADVVGINCRLGPHHMLKALEEVPLPTRAYLSAYPNASLPTYTDGVFHYEGDAEYFRKSAHLFRDQGIRLLGGCCGTTPEHIRAFAQELRNVAPITVKKHRPMRQQITIHHEHPKRELPSLQEIVKKRPSILVELDPPRKLDTTRFFEGAMALKESGIDAITLADNSLASPRICNTAIGQLVKNQVGLRPLIHLTCRDRNIIGLQSHLMGLHTLGLQDVLVITGDPARVGDFPGASSVYDVSSFELISMIKQLNEGLSTSGKDLGQTTSFSVAGAFNPNVRYLEKAVMRLEKKLACGADYFISQPVFSVEKLIEVHDATKHLQAPIYIGLMPLTSHRNTEFLHHEVPGIKISDTIRAQMEKYKDDPVQACRAGIEITKNLVDAALELFNGIYFITPFLRYELSVELVNYTNKRISEFSRRSDNAQSIIH